MTAADKRLKAMTDAATKAMEGPAYAKAPINDAEIVAAMLDAYFENTRFTREVAGTTYRLKPEPVE